MLTPLRRQLPRTWRSPGSSLSECYAAAWDQTGGCIEAWGAEVPSSTHGLGFVGAAFADVWGSFSLVSFTWASPAVVDALYGTYVFRDTPRVARFLNEHPHLIPLLARAYPEIEARFGKGALVYLEVFAYPDAPRSEELFAIIGTNHRPAEARDALLAFRREWWLSALPEAEHCLTFDFECL
jgi:hypothetical protein